MWSHTFRQWLRRYLAQARKMLQKSKSSKNISTLQIASERVRMHPSRSEQVRAHLRSHENLENLAKTSRKLRETRAPWP